MTNRPECVIIYMERGRGNSQTERNKNYVHHHLQNERLHHHREEKRSLLRENARRTPQRHSNPRRCGYMGRQISLPFLYMNIVKFLTISRPGMRRLVKFLTIEREEKGRVFRSPICDMLPNNLSLFRLHIRYSIPLRFLAGCRRLKGFYALCTNPRKREEVL